MSLDLLDRLNENQDSGSETPKLDITRRLELKFKNDDRKEVGLCYWDSEAEDGEGANVFIEEPLKGIYIDSYNVIEAYSDDLGRNGGTYHSTPYYRKEHSMALFGGGEKVATGNYDDIMGFLNENSTDKGKTRKVILLLTEQGLFAIKTNMSIWIDQSNRIKNSLKTNLISITSAILDVKSDDHGMSAKCIKVLGKLAKSNPPKYADVELGAEIKAKDLTKYGLTDEFLNEFIEWKEYTVNSSGEESLSLEDEQAFEEDRSKEEFDEADSPI